MPGAARNILETSSLDFSGFSVLTYNIHKGFSGDGRRRFVLDRMRDALRSSGADIVFVQEAQGQHSGRARSVHGWPEDAQFEYLADSVWPHHAYGRNAVYDDGHHGNAILSRYPLLDWSNTPVSPWPFPASRSLLYGRVHIGDRPEPLHLICVHLGFLGWERVPQVRRLCRFVEEHVGAGEPVIVAGDFNDWSGSAERDLDRALGLREAHRTVHGLYARTYPSWAPTLPMDRIYCRGLDLKDARRLGGEPWRRLSDHTPIQAWFGT